MVSTLEKCQCSELIWGAKIQVKRYCRYWALYKVTQLATGDTVLVCREHVHNYARREDMFKVELLV